MLERFSYARLKEITETQQRYRGRKFTSYPWHDRRHNGKFFVPVEKNGKTMFYVFYEAYGLPTGWDNDNIGEPLFIIHDDESVEFRNPDVGQGFVTIMYNGLSSGYFQSERRRGGLTYRQSLDGYEIILPCQTGMRYYMANCKPHEEALYDVVIRKVDMKESNKMMKAYKDKLNSIKVWFSALTDEDIKKYLDQYYNGDSKELVSEEKENEESDIITWLCGLSYHFDTPNRPSSWSWEWRTRENADAEKERQTLLKVLNKTYIHAMRVRHDTFKKETIPCEMRYYPATANKLTFEFRKEA